jgi:hypothetical protein
MHEASWEDPREMLSNGQEMPGSVRPNMVPVQTVAGPGSATVRSQDDARVGYLFQRPPPQGQQADINVQPPGGPGQFVNKAWIGGERGLEQVSEHNRYLYL